MKLNKPSNIKCLMKTPELEQSCSVGLPHLRWYSRMPRNNTCLLIISHSSSYARFSVLHGQQFPLSATHINVFPLYSLPIFLQIKHLTRNLKALFSSHPHFKSTSPHAAHKKLSVDNASVARRMGALGLSQANGTFVLHKGSCCYHGLEFCMRKQRKMKHPKDPGESCFR